MTSEQPNASGYSNTQQQTSLVVHNISTSGGAWSLRKYAGGPYLTGDNVRVTTIDVGWDTYNLDLWSNPNRHVFMSSYSGPATFVGYGGASYAPDSDAAQTSFYHGIHTATAIAGRRGNQYGIAGVAPNADIDLARVAGDGSSVPLGKVNWAAAAAAMNGFVAAGAKVINMSFAASGGISYTWNWWSPWNRYSNDPMLLAAQNANSKGVILVASAGNENALATDVDFWNNFSSQYVPCGFSVEVVCVGAINRDKAKSSFSNYGPAVDIYAYGGDNNYQNITNNIDRAPSVYTANVFCYPCTNYINDFTLLYPSANFGGTSLRDCLKTV